MEPKKLPFQLKKQSKCFLLIINFCVISKLRIKLGLRPLDVTKAGSDKNQLAEQRYEDLKQQRLKDAAEKKARQRLEEYLLHSCHVC